VFLDRGIGLRADGVYAVGGAPGLYLRVEGASCAWVLRYALAGQRRRMGRSYPAVMLAMARELARRFSQPGFSRV